MCRGKCACLISEWATGPSIFGNPSRLIHLLLLLSSKTQSSTTRCKRARHRLSYRHCDDQVVDKERGIEISFYCTEPQIWNHCALLDGLSISNEQWMSLIGDDWVMFSRGSSTTSKLHTRRGPRTELNDTSSTIILSVEWNKQNVAYLGTIFQVSTLYTKDSASSCDIHFTSIFLHRHSSLITTFFIGRNQSPPVRAIAPITILLLLRSF